jgi:hypothetical protein
VAGRISLPRRTSANHLTYHLRIMQGSAKAQRVRAKGFGFLACQIKYRG